MRRRLPFESLNQLLLAADQVWAEMDAPDYLEAFSGHPEIGAAPPVLEQNFASTANWSAAEQSGVASASDSVRDALREANLAYKARFGYVFIVCASGKTAQEMLDLVQARLAHEPSAELAVAAAEQAKITKLRLRKLGT